MWINPDERFVQSSDHDPNFMCVADGLSMRGGLWFGGGRGQSALKERLDDERGDPRRQQPEHPLQQGELAREVAAQQVDLRLEALLGLL
jgi:hypothetical protein